MTDCLPACLGHQGRGGGGGGTGQPVGRGRSDGEKEKGKAIRRAQAEEATVQQKDAVMGMTLTQLNGT